VDDVATPSVRKPNVLIIGAPRCASTSLAFLLEQHPDIYVCDAKEPHFLAMHGRTGEITGIGAEAFAWANRLSHREWSDLFRGRSERCLIDASVTTISYPDVSIDNIREYCDSETKIIVILRNPVDRAYSSYLYCASRGWLAGSFEACLEAEPARIDEGWQHLWFLRFLSQYERRLQPFLDAFARENIHITITEEFSDDPEAVLRDILRFLDLPPAEFDTAARYNPGGVPRSPLMGQASAFVRSRPMLLKGLKLISTRGFREELKRRSVEKVEMAEDTRRRLAEELSATKPWVQGQIGRELPAWD
jgi:hypothetical protein